MLGIGGYLVINNQLSLGQLVAAEIVLGAVIYALKRVGILLENYYDLKASQHKLENVLMLPGDKAIDELDDLFTPISTIEFKLHGNAEAIASNQKPLFIYSHIPELCQTFTDALFGFSPKDNLEVFINNAYCSHDNRVALRAHSLLIGRPQWFAGTIYDNLVLNQRQLSSKVIIEQLRAVGLLDKVMHQPDGLKTIIYEWQTIFTERELIQFMVVRALLVKPQVLIIDRAFDVLDNNIDELMAQLLTLDNTILLIVSQHNECKYITNRWELS